MNKEDFSELLVYMEKPLLEELYARGKKIASETGVSIFDAMRYYATALTNKTKNNLRRL